MKSGRTLLSLAQELERQLHSKKDLIVPSQLVHHSTGEDGQTHIIVNQAGNPVRYGVTPLARRQLADKLKIPHAYFERMREEQPVLLDRNVNTWLQSEDDRRMLRTLDGQVRAVLSDRYRRLDNFDLAESVLPILQQLPEVRFESVELTETRMYLKCITSRLTYEMAPGDVVQAAVSEASFRQTAQKLQKTLRIPLVGDPVRTVEVLAQRYTLNDVERSGVLRHLITEGELSGYGLVNAVTHYSQEIDDYDRATEVEALGGKLIELGTAEWKGLAEAI